MKLQDLFKWTGTIDRKNFLLVGLILFAVKYNLDRLIAKLEFNRYWIITDYFIQADKLSVTELNNEDFRFYVVLVLAALPFIYIGTLLCIKRLRDIDLPLILVILFFVPFINIIYFIILSLLPSKQSNVSFVEKHKFSLLDKLIPVTKWGSALLAIGLVVSLAILTTIFSIHFLQEYGWSLFVGVPFVSGLASAIIYGYHEPRSLAECLRVSFLTVLIFSILVIVLAVEGLLCVLMAAPIGLGLGLVGGVIGFVIQNRSVRSTPTFLFSIFAIVPLLSFLEYREEPEAPLMQVKTEVIIAQSPEVVWNNLVEFNHMNEPKELLFHSGIAYPIKAEIKGKGVGAVRECIFTTGPFIEPIQVWDEPRLLKFSVIDQPPPMVELSFYDHLNVPHLDGYFRSEKGQFLLTRLENGHTKLEGTTWYRHNIWPVAYWKTWSDYILHKIHLRVLNHIKTKSEKRK